MDDLGGRCYKCGFSGHYAFQCRNIVNGAEMALDVSSTSSEDDADFGAKHKQRPIQQAGVQQPTSRSRSRSPLHSKKSNPDYKDKDQKKVKKRKASKSKELMGKQRRQRRRSTSSSSTSDSSHRAADKKRKKEKKEKKKKKGKKKKKKKD